MNAGRLLVSDKLHCSITTVSTVLLTKCTCKSKSTRNVDLCVKFVYIMYKQHFIVVVGQHGAICFIYRCLTTVLNIASSFLRCFVYKFLNL